MYIFQYHEFNKHMKSTIKDFKNQQIRLKLSYLTLFSFQN